MDEIQKKNTVSNKDVLFMMGKMFELILDQKNYIQSTMDDLLGAQQNRINQLEMEILTIKNEVLQLKSKPAETAKQETDQNLISELQDRNIRSRNIIVHNVNESNSEITTERIDFDKAQVLQILDKLEFDTTIEFKVNRIGMSGEKPRPMRVVLPDANIALKVVKQKKKLNNNPARISADLTFRQRQELKKLYEELNTRKENGEDNLSIRYTKGVPYIHCAKNPREQNQLTGT